jgi:hypothetical protein
MNAAVQTEAPQADEAKAAKPTAIFETVTMSDGRKVEFSGAPDSTKRSRLLKEVIVDEAANSVAVRFDFRNGETRLFTVPSKMILQFAGHGASQKIGDETAGESDVDDMTIAVDELIDRLNNGEWAVRREGGGFAGTSILLKALVEKSGKPIEVMKAWLKGKTQQEKMALRGHPSLKPIVDRLEAEKINKGAKVDSDALLDEAIAL